MRILNIRSFPGPNVWYSDKPVLEMELDLEDLAGRESCDVPGFVDRLMAALPGVEEHHCGLGRRGGFVERLREGTWFGHVVEHVALELTDAAGISVNHGKTRDAGNAGVFYVVVACRNEAGMRCLLQTAVDLVQALVDNAPFDLAPRLDEARRAVHATSLGPSTQALVDAAEVRGIPWRRLDDAGLVQLGYGVRRRHIAAALTSHSASTAVDIVADKNLTRRLLADAFLPVPEGRVVYNEAELACAFRELRAPVVVKPLDASQGRGVVLGIETLEDALNAFAAAHRYSRGVVVEEQLTGNDYRVLVVNGRTVAASHRTPAGVTGNGSSTVRELIVRTNEDPRRGDGHDNVLTRICIDQALLDRLARSGRNLEYVPAPGEFVQLRDTANLSTGGCARDVTDEVHETISRLCERAARCVGLDVCGVDLIAEDISRPLNPGGGIVELNAAPGLRMHLYPSHGAPRDVAGAIIESLYPEGAPSRVPIVSITGTNGKTTTTRLLGHIVQCSGQNCGVTTTDGIWIGGRCIAEGDLTGPASARAVLSDPTVEVAVLETARGGIRRRGLGYDWSDVGVLTNIEADHIGQDGIQTVDDILRIKKLVARRTREGGTLVLNADDPRLAALPQDPDVAEVQRRIVYFSLDPDNPVILRHISAGNTALIADRGWVVEAAGPARWRIAHVSRIPITFSGAGAFQVANVLAAAAAARAIGIGRDVLSRALPSFDANRDNPGRVNLYRVGSAWVLVDYGHNAPAFQAMCDMAKRWIGRQTVGVVGVPGDRRDDLLEAAARAAAGGFGSIIIREDRDLRGRREGEVPRLLERIVRETAPHVPCRVIPAEQEALETAIASAQPGGVVVAFCEDSALVAEVLARHGATPVKAVEPMSEVAPDARAV